MNESQGKWVPALVIESNTTPKQRERNFAFYQRIQNGVEGDHRQGGIKQFVFDVPVSSCSMGGSPPEFTFRLDPASECHRRLVSYIVGHTDEKCDADDEVLRLRAQLVEANRLACDRLVSLVDRDQTVVDVLRAIMNATGGFPAATS